MKPVQSAMQRGSAEQLCVSPWHSLSIWNRAADGWQREGWGVCATYHRCLTSQARRREISSENDAELLNSAPADRSNELKGA